MRCKNHKMGQFDHNLISCDVMPKGDINPWMFMLAIGNNKDLKMLEIYASEKPNVWVRKFGRANALKNG